MTVITVYDAIEILENQGVLDTYLAMYNILATYHHYEREKYYRRCRRAGKKNAALDVCVAFNISENAFYKGRTQLLRPLTKSEQQALQKISALMAEMNVLASKNGTIFCAHDQIFLQKSAIFRIFFTIKWFSTFFRGSFPLSSDCLWGAQMVSIICTFVRSYCFE